MGEENQLDDAGATALAEALKTHYSLATLNLGKNQIADVGACAIAALLAVNQTVQRINLVRHSIGQEGGVAVAKALLNGGSMTAMENDGSSGCITVTRNENNLA